MRYIINDDLKIICFIGVPDFDDVKELTSVLPQKKFGRYKVIYTAEQLPLQQQAPPVQHNQIIPQGEA